MPIATPQESGSDNDTVNVLPQEKMSDEKPSLPIKVEVDIGAKNENENGNVNEKTESIENGSTGMSDKVEQDIQEYDELEEKIEAAVKKFRQRTARSVVSLGPLAEWPLCQSG